MIDWGAIDPRRKARMVALQCLFAMDLREWAEEPPLEWVTEENPLPNDAGEFALGLVSGVKDARLRLDDVILRYASAWPVAQLAVVDRNVLRIALFELLYEQETPRKSAVNEAVEVAKVFGSESSTRFVNGVLGSIIADLESGELAPMKEEPVC